MRQREQYDTFLEEQKYVVWGLFIECHTEKQGATKFHIRAAARDENSTNNFPNVSHSESGLLYSWVFSDCPNINCSLFSYLP